LFCGIYENVTKAMAKLFNEKAKQGFTVANWQENLKKYFAKLEKVQ